MTVQRAAWWNPRWGWKVWAMVAFLLVPTFGFALWVLAEAGGQTKIDPQTLGLASGNSGGFITAITGTEHTVYHANDPLPEPKAHRADGKLTLAWFTSTNCAKCEDQIFVHTTMKDFRRDVVFMEKDAGREPAMERLNVTSLPTFVWLDSEGNELGRFTETDDASLRAEVERMLNRDN